MSNERGGKNFFQKSAWPTGVLRAINLLLGGRRPFMWGSNLKMENDRTPATFLMSLPPSPTHAPSP
jgi:hypothetical protein